MVDHSTIQQDWPDIAKNHPVPTQLYDHQLDAMALLKERKNVFLGINKFLDNQTFH